MIPLFTTGQVREADDYAIKQLGIPSLLLMENASLSIYGEIIKYFPEIMPGCSIGIICGKGNNGGDGFALARHFLTKGFDVIVISMGKESELKGDVITNYKILKKIIETEDRGRLIEYSGLENLNYFKKCSIVADAILGTGSKGKLREPYNLIVQKLNEGKFKRVAADIPTGLDADTASGDIIFNADLTVSLAEFKAGLFFGKGFPNTGKVVKGSIGTGNLYFDELEVDTYLIEPEDAVENLPERKKDIHKYSSGKVLVIAGSSDYPVAPSFCANAAQTVGAGAVILAVPESVKNIVHSKVEISVVKTYDDENSGYLRENNIKQLKEYFDWADAILIGPGLGRNADTLNTVLRIIKDNSNRNIVLDADAVYAFKNDIYKKHKLGNTIFTPHNKEFADLIGIDILTLEQDLLKYGLLFVEQTGAVLVLKGAPTVIFLPTGEVLINSAGNSGLAKFGSGDVLSGVIGGLLAQNKNREQSVISGVYIHSFNADLLAEKLTEYGFSAIDQIKNLPKTIKFLNDATD